MTGMNCEGCKENYPYAEANQSNGKLVCYGCKASGFVLTYTESQKEWYKEIVNYIKENDFLKTPIEEAYNFNFYGPRHISKTPSKESIEKEGYAYIELNSDGSIYDEEFKTDFTAEEIEEMYLKQYNDFCKTNPQSIHSIEMTILKDKNK